MKSEVRPIDWDPTLPFTDLLFFEFICTAVLVTFLLFGDYNC